MLILSLSCEGKKCRLLLILERPWIFFQIFKAWKVLENRHRPWKFLNLCLKVLRSAWIWFSKMPWLNKWFHSNRIQWQLLMRLVNFSDNSSFRLMLEGIKLSNVNWTCLYILIKVPVWFNLVPFIYLLYGPWKSLRSPWICFFQMGKNHECSNSGDAHIVLFITSYHMTRISAPGQRWWALFICDSVTVDCLFGLAVGSRTRLRWHVWWAAETTNDARGWRKWASPWWRRWTNAWWTWGWYASWERTPTWTDAFDVKLWRWSWWPWGHDAARCCADGLWFESGENELSEAVQPLLSLWQCREGALASFSIVLTNHSLISYTGWAKKCATYLCHLCQLLTDF